MSVAPFRKFKSADRLFRSSMQITVGTVVKSESNVLKHDDDLFEEEFVGSTSHTQPFSRFTRRLTNTYLAFCLLRSYDKLHLSINKEIFFFKC